MKIKTVLLSLMVFLSFQTQEIYSQTESLAKPVIAVSETMEDDSLDKLVAVLKHDLEQKEYLSDFEKEISISFQLDTFRIEKQLQKNIEKDSSTAGMVQAAYDAEKNYDLLLNKYYQVLLNKLNASDREALKLAQRNWVYFRDSERKLSNGLVKEEYSGGGSLQRLVVAADYLDLTKKRVVDLHKYLLRFNSL